MTKAKYVEKMTDELLSWEPVEAADMAILADFASDYDVGATLQDAIASLLTYCLLKRAQRIYGAEERDREIFISGAGSLGHVLAGRMCQALDDATEPVSAHLDEMKIDIMALGVRAVREGRQMAEIILRRADAGIDGTEGGV